MVDVHRDQDGENDANKMVAMVILLFLHNAIWKEPYSNQYVNRWDEGRSMKPM